MKKLTDTVTFRHGATVETRIVQPPMTTFSGDSEGRPTQATFDYYDARSESAGMVIVEFSYVHETGGSSNPVGLGNQLAFYNDSYLEDMKRIATSIKRNGNKAVLQIHHGGREARKRAQEGKEVLAPSAIDYSFLPYKVREMTNEEILDIIKSFGAATKRAIDAGFDGVEIHGANHYGIQQFFSKISNHRTDDWGGSLEKRMAFPLAIVKEVTRVAREYGPKYFIVGYRISPEEIHGEDIGYDYKEAQELIKEVDKFEPDYIHISLFGGYSSGPANVDRSYAELFRDVLSEDTKLIIVNGIFSEEAAADALQYTDFIAVGRGTLIDPEFGKKIKEGRGNTIVHEITPEQLQERSHWTPGLLEVFADPDHHVGLPYMPGWESITQFYEGWSQPDENG